MKKIQKTAMLLAVLIFVLLGCSAAVLAAEANEDNAAEIAVTAEAAEASEEAEAEKTDSGVSFLSVKAIAAGAVVALVAGAGAIGMTMVICKTTDNMARQPEASSQINGAMMLGLVFIETAIIYALIVAILIIFVL